MIGICEKQLEKKTDGFETKLSFKTQIINEIKINEIKNFDCGRRSEWIQMHKSENKSWFWTVSILRKIWIVILSQILNGGTKDASRREKNKN